MSGTAGNSPLLINSPPKKSAINVRCNRLASRGAPPGLQGRAAYKQWISHLRSAFPDLKLTALTYLVAEGDQVIGRWSLTGTHNGNLSIIRATNRPVNLAVMAAFRFTDERILDCTLSYDLFTLVRQLGLVPELPGISPALPIPSMSVPV